MVVIVLSIGLLISPIYNLLSLSKIILLTVHLSLSGLVATETVLIQIITTSKTYNVFDLTAGTGTEIYSGTVIANMSATDTANITVIVSGGAKTVSVQNNLSNSGFYGTLLC